MSADRSTPGSLRSRLAFGAAALIALSVLQACGGGGGGGGTTSGPSGSDGGTTAPTTPAAPTPVATRLSGVAATGAPLAGARVRVVDAAGTVVGTTTTHAADGSYALTLAPALAPLLIQAVGSDAAGQPVVLHSAVPITATSAVAHVTPITEAIVALTLGSDPKVVFAAAATQAAAIKSLATLTPASDFVKGLIKTPLTDAKTGDAKKLDLLADPAFAANKSGVDLALEALALGYGNDAKGATQLQLGNKLAGTPLEVLVDLETARAEFAKATPAPAGAITSTLKTVTSPTTTMANLGGLDELTTALNKVIADSNGDSAATPGLLSKAGLLGKYTSHNGTGASGVASRLAAFAAKGMQLGRLQVTGCADETIAKSGCVRVTVAARVSDAAGKETDTFADAVAYDAKTTPKWMLTGNGHAADVTAQSTAWLALGADGSAAPAGGAAAVTPLTGVQLLIGSSVASASVQTPGGYVLPMTGCARGTLCISTATAGSPAKGSTGGLGDDTVFRNQSQWLGAADVAAGARYKASLVKGDGSVSVRSGVVRSAFTAAPAPARFAVLDEVKASAPIPGTALLGKATLSWAAWAEANPDMRLVYVRAAFGDGNGGVQIVQAAPKSWSATSLEWSAPEFAEGFGVAGVTLWLAAVDGAGRWYHTSYSVF